MTHFSFTKAHGLGNDFILVEARLAPADPAGWARRLCDRHTGIGGDGVLLHAPAADGVRMRFSRAAIQSVLAEDPEGADTKEAGSGS